MESAGRSATAREREQELASLLAERDGLLTVLDRVLTLRGTAHRMRDATGAAAGFVADAAEPGAAVIRWLAGMRTDLLQDLVVPVGQGVGGRVLALGAPVRVSDYVSAPTITHQFDVPVRSEAFGAMLAVPVLQQGEAVAIAYAALRGPGRFGDAAVDAASEVARDAARALLLAERAEAGRQTAVAAERQRMQASLHDSVGAMLFSIGAQVRDLRETIPDNPVLAGRLGRLESDVSAASAALREALLALAETDPERAVAIEVAQLCRSFEARTGTPARFVQLGPIPALDAERSAVLVGAVREGLLNAEKHAGATACVVSLGETDGGVLVAVADDGAAPPSHEPPAPGTGLGLRLLSDRAARAGGHVSLVHDDDGGTTLRMHLPLASAP